MRYDMMQLICQTVATLRADRTLIYVVNDHVIAVATGSKEVKSIIQSRKAKTSRVRKLLAMGADAETVVVSVSVWGFTTRRKDVN